MKAITELITKAEHAAEVLANAHRKNDPGAWRRNAFVAEDLRRANARVIDELAERADTPAHALEDPEPSIGRTADIVPMLAFIAAMATLAQDDEDAGDETQEAQKHE